jgi:V8-like Glu-specific endopeptidase
MNFSIKLALVSLSLLAFTACSATPATEGQADPIVDGHRATKYKEAVVIDMLRSGARVAGCSGVLVAPRVVLTAGHCVAEFDDFAILAPFANGQWSRAHRTATYDWRARGEAVDPNAHDLGLIFLDTPIQLATYPKLAHAPVADGKRLINVGRIHNGHVASDALYDKAVPVGIAAPYGFPFDYIADDVIEPGDSGGPDFIPGSAHTIAAVNSGANQQTEVLARVDLLADWIEAAILHSGVVKASPPACAHDYCDVGKALSAGCDPCVAAICDWDPQCCGDAWDGACVKDVAEICGPVCP